MKCNCEQRIGVLEAELTKLRERVRYLQAELTYAAELLGTSDPTAKAANLETSVDLLKRLARDESSVIREGAGYGLDIQAQLAQQKPAAPADIRAAVERETKPLLSDIEKLRDHLSIRTRDRDAALAEVDRLKAALSSERSGWYRLRLRLADDLGETGESWEYIEKRVRELRAEERKEANELRRQLREQAAEVERLRAERFSGATRANLEALCRYLNDTCSKEPEFYPGGDVAGIAMVLLSRARSEVERLKGELARARFQPIAKDDQGVARFKGNAAVMRLLDESQARGFGLNEMAAIKFPMGDREQFYQLLGYSVSGYGDLDVSSESVAAADAIVHELLTGKSAPAQPVRKDGAPGTKGEG